MNITLVSSCILIKKNKFLTTERPKGKHFAHYWEFPGGKLEETESFYDAIIRELYEELDIRVKKENLNIIDNISHSYQRNHIIVMAVFILKKWSGVISSKERQKMRWLEGLELNKLRFLEGSKIILEKINSNLYDF